MGSDFVDLNHLLDGGPFESAKGEGSGQRLKSPHSSRAPTDERNDMSDEIGEMLCATGAAEYHKSGCRLSVAIRKSTREEERRSDPGKLFCAHICQELECERLSVVLYTPRARV
jgi:hypothetical protein